MGLPATGLFSPLRFLLRALLLRALLLSALLPLVSLSVASAATSDEQRQARLVDLGRALFFDVNLSFNRTQSCATCHDPARAFIDWRDSGVSAAASLGDDGHSLGDRNAPTLSYAALTPPLQRNAAGEWLGGQFLEGRAPTLADQAQGPPMNLLEMAMPDTASVVARLQENPNYAREIPALFGDNVFSDEARTLQAMGESIAAFEQIEFFSPFDSKYDRYLRGDYEPTNEELLGITLFFSNQFTNCNLCHQLKTLPEAEGELFTNHLYHNIGVPVNRQLREASGLGEDYVDIGLAGNPLVADSTQAGKFKVPTLRNVALTGPYMHNGVFADLKTVLLFYNKYLTRSSKAQINPESGEQWGPPEVAENISFEELQAGRVLDDRAINALLAFMRMLTDRRYEPLLEFTNSGETGGGATGRGE